MNKEQTILSRVPSELEIDALGQIWRIARRGGNRLRGGIRITPMPRHRAEYRQRGGYLLVAVNVENVRYVAGAHRLVWTYFNGPIPDGHEINHKNGVKDDNRPENLEPATGSANRRHALEVLRVNRNRPKGSLHPKTKLTEADVIEIRRLRLNGMMVKDIAGQYAMKKRAISAICCRRTWQHI